MWGGHQGGGVSEQTEPPPLFRTLGRPVVLALGLARGQAGPAWGGALALGFCLWLAPVSVVTVGPGGLREQGHLCIFSGPHEVSAAGTVCRGLGARCKKGGRQA